MPKPKRYLVCPLNWGLGHASRMIPVITSLIKENHQVILAADGSALGLLQQSFPELTTIKLADVQIKFSSHQSAFKLIQLIPALLINIFKEHQRVKKIISDFNIDVIISDNRYGLWNKRIESIFISHQMMIKLPCVFKFMEWPVHLCLKSIICQYNYCWIPDYATKEKSLSGDLSHKYPLPHNAKFIGPLSRFSITPSIVLKELYDTVAILSGPEPARSDFEQKIISCFHNTHQSVLIIQGKPSLNNHTQLNNITIVSSLSALKTKFFLEKAQRIICRPGYSTIMDLEYLNTKVLFVPTPGQTEQEYLSLYLKRKYPSLQQDKFGNLKEINNLV